MTRHQQFADDVLGALGRGFSTSTELAAELCRPYQNVFGVLVELEGLGQVKRGRPVVGEHGGRPAITWRIAP